MRQLFCGLKSHTTNRLAIVCLVGYARTTLEASGFYNCTAGFGAHAFTEPVDTLTVSNSRLKCTLWHLPVSLIYMAFIGLIISPQLIQR